MSNSQSKPPSATKSPTAAGSDGSAIPSATGPKTLKLKKGQALFSEGENSKAMYLLKTGLIRIYKKKGTSFIELDTIHAGSILGELAFLDGLPRSASGEALIDCELIEISGPTFTQTMSKMPEWLKSLLKTVVSRLRAASNRIRQLEAASTQLDYSAKDGRGANVYTYIPTIELLKGLSAILLVASRHGESTNEGVRVKLSQIIKYANQISGIAAAKCTTLIEVLADVKLALGTDKIGSGSDDFLLTNVDLIDKAISYINDQNLLESSKKTTLSQRGLAVLSALYKNLDSAPKVDEKNVRINAGAVRLSEQQSNGGKELFRLDELEELVQQGFIGKVEMKSASEQFSVIEKDRFIVLFRIYQIIKSIDIINEQKRLGATK